MKVTQKQLDLAEALERNLSRDDILKAMEHLTIGYEESERQAGREPKAVRPLDFAGDLFVSAVIALEEDKSIFEVA